MKETLYAYFADALDGGTLSPVAERMLYDYSMSHLYWAIGWAVPCVIFCFIFVVGMNGFSDLPEDDKGNTALGLFLFLGLALFFLFRVIDNVVVFLHPLASFIN